MGRRARAGPRGGRRREGPRRREPAKVGAGGRCVPTPAGFPVNASPPPAPQNRRDPRCGATGERPPSPTLRGGRMQQAEMGTGDKVMPPGGRERDERPPSPFPAPPGVPVSRGRRGRAGDSPRRGFSGRGAAGIATNAREKKILSVFLSSSKFLSSISIRNRIS